MEDLLKSTTTTNTTTTTTTTSNSNVTFRTYSNCGYNNNSGTRVPSSIRVRDIRKQCRHLFWLTVDQLLTNEDIRMGRLEWNHTQKITSIRKLLQSFSFHRALLACTTEVVLVAHGQQCHLFPYVCSYFQITVLEMFRMIEPFVKTHPALPKLLLHHLKWCENRIILESAWQQEQETFVLFKQHRQTLLLIGFTSRTKSYTPLPPLSPLSSPPPRLPTLLNSFFKKVTCLAFSRLGVLFKSIGVLYHQQQQQQLQHQQLQQHPQQHPATSNKKDQQYMNYVWSVVLQIITNMSWLLQNRHLDQILLCSLYLIRNTMGIQTLSFENILNHYSAVLDELIQYPTSDTSTCVNYAYNTTRQVLLQVTLEPTTALTATPPPAAAAAAAAAATTTVSHLFTFYNTVFLPAMQGFALQLKDTHSIVYASHSSTVVHGTRDDSSSKNNSSSVSGRSSSCCRSEKGGTGEVSVTGETIALVQRSLNTTHMAHS